jgi:hypothetical protein
MDFNKWKYKQKLRAKEERDKRRVDLLKLKYSGGGKFAEHAVKSNPFHSHGMGEGHLSQASFFPGSPVADRPFSSQLLSFSDSSFHAPEVYSYSASHSTPDSSH